MPFGGSFGEYSLNDFEEQPNKENGSSSKLLGSFPGSLLDPVDKAGLLESLVCFPERVGELAEQTTLRTSTKI